MKDGEKLLLIPIATAILAILPLPSEAYPLVRVVICVSAATMALSLFNRKDQMWFAFLILAIVFNPIVPLYIYDKGIWVIIDIVAASLFLSKVPSLGHFLRARPAGTKPLMDRMQSRNSEGLNEREEATNGQRKTLNPKVSSKDNIDAGIYQKSEMEQRHDRVITLNSITETLSMQFALAGYREGQKPTDDFIIGYVAGYCDAVMQKRGMDNNSVDGLAIISLVFIELFGETGDLVVNHFFKVQENPSSELTEGMLAGGNDVFDWLDGKRHPMGLRRFLKERRK